MEREQTGHELCLGRYLRTKRRSGRESQLQKNPMCCTFLTSRDSHRRLHEWGEGSGFKKQKGASVL